MTDIERIDDSRWADPPDSPDAMCECGHPEHEHDQDKFVKNTQYGDYVQFGCSHKDCVCQNFKEAGPLEVEFEHE